MFSRVRIGEILTDKKGIPWTVVRRVLKASDPDFFYDYVLTTVLLPGEAEDEAPEPHVKVIVIPQDVLYENYRALRF